MTPPLNPQSGSASQLGLQFTAGPQPASDLHLTSDQMSALLVSWTEGETGAAETHLRACAACAVEFASLREALALFQQASIACADLEFASLRKPAFPILPPRRVYSQALVWVAASAVLLAAILPIEMRWQRTVSTPPVAVAPAAVSTTESDEALLEDVNRELSLSVPASMQPLADPTGDSSAIADTQTESPTQTSAQRKD